jgi:hypothetical protein
MRRSDPIYKPALLLVVLDLLREGLAHASAIPLALALQRFDALLARAGLLDHRGSGRAFMPAYHLSSSSKTEEPFWSLYRERRPIGTCKDPSSNSALLRLADSICLEDELAMELESFEGIEVAYAAIHQLLEDDGRSDCTALLDAHDADKSLVEERMTSLVEGEQYPFRLDDLEARTMLTVREHVVRDRSLRRAVLPAYDFSCALCSSRIVWNNLSEVEVAHIKPRSLRGVDDPRNTLALCQTHHWAFDLGLWSAGEDLQVKVATPNPQRGDDLGALCAFEGRRLTEPRRETARPHPEALRWHLKFRFNRAA